MAHKLTVLIVEDEKVISNFITTILVANDYNILKAEKGKDAIALVTSQCVDIVLLDLGLPDIDGLDVLRKLREWSHLPIIVVSARGHEREKVEALDLGADDYITKPFGTSELLARIRTAFRHSEKGLLKENINRTAFTIGELTIDLDKRVSTLAGKEIHFTPIEFKIVALLVSHAGKVLTHDFIIKAIWGLYATSENQALRVNMANIRRKIEENPAEPHYILTEIGVGYKMVEEAE